MNEVETEVPEKDKSWPRRKKEKKKKGELERG